MTSKFLPLTLITLIAAPVSAAALKGAALMPMAKVSLAAARHTALAARAGTIKDQELERENGGSGLRYSFDILSGGKVYEVGVDARTGKLLENGVDAKAD